MRYFVPSQPGASAIFEDVELAKRCCLSGEEPVPLQGVWKRLKPQKLEKSVEVTVTVDKDGYPQNCDFDKHRGYPFRTMPECHGKTGTLTFTWTE